MGIRRADGPSGQRILTAIFPSKRNIADFSATIANEKANYEKLKSNRIFFRNTYGAVLALMTVLVLFAAVWLGLFLSKKITEPIEALTAATKEISAGNLDYRVDVKAGDELGMLVTMFNDMASRLQGTTTELERDATTWRSSLKVSRRGSLLLIPISAFILSIEQHGRCSLLGGDASR
jgi:two-component system nitrogen regulation sensor histidine kinase NtrY